MYRYGIVVAGCVAIVGAFGAATGAQEVALDPHVGPVGPRAIAFGTDCAGGEIYDDGTVENGYSGLPEAGVEFAAVQRFTPADYPATYDTVCVALLSHDAPNLDFAIEIRDDDGPGGGPGALLGSVAASASDLPSEPPCRFYQYDISSLGLTIPSGSVWIGVRWDSTLSPLRFLCIDESPTTPLHPGFFNFDDPDDPDDDDDWLSTHSEFTNYRAKLVRAVPGVVETEGFFPDAIEVDVTDVGSSNENGVFEPGEEVEVAPAWTNGHPATQEDVFGTAFGFTGPAGPEYDLVVDTASYGSVAPDQISSCRDGGTCYQMSIGPDGGTRPAQHWDAAFDETLSEGSVHPWTLHVGSSFDDVSPGHFFYPFIETLLHRGVTSGCVGDDYCPAASVTRAQMAIFVLRSLLGAVYTPPACKDAFDDVLCPSAFADWIEDLHARGIVSGCGGDNFCPAANVTRAQMAIFMLKGLIGPDYTPPTCTGVFDDVPCSSLFAAWVEDLADRGITSGCGGDDYCPGAPVSRGQMAVFLSKTFGLTLYGP